MNRIELFYIDLFCGAGGTSSGVEYATVDGRKCAEVIACVNHDANVIGSLLRREHFRESIYNYRGCPTTIKSKTVTLHDAMEMPETTRL